MTLTQAAKQRACDLANAERWPDDIDEILPRYFPLRVSPAARALAQLCQDISDAVKACNASVGGRYMPMDRFILPDEPDILAEQRRVYEQNRAELAEDIANGKRWLAHMEALLAQRGHRDAPIGGEA